MKPIRTGMAVTAVLGGVLAGRKLVETRGRAAWPAADPRKPRWHTVTVNRPQDQVAPDGRLPAPLAQLADRVEIQVRPAPDAKGTEIAARPRDGERSGAARPGGRDPRWEVRRALRETKQILETGEVLQPHRPPTNERTPTNRPLEYAVRHGREEGRL